jgi:phage shock protein PspC (stress-responsive transcriptional regulator)
MKKNININLFGTLYSIDEDAYELLKKYQDNMRSYYSRREGGEEIADDVEHRVAELFAELRKQGFEAITIEQVEEIIHRIGDPQEMEDEEGKEEKFTSEPLGEEIDKRFYRDPEDKMVAGIISGACHYFGFKDPLPWRIIFFLLCIFTYAGFIIAYLIIWALVPEAKTAEERLKMRGKPVNPKTLNEEIMRGVNKTKEFVQNPQNQDKAKGCLGTLLKICLFCIGAFLLVIFGGLLCGILIPVAIFIIAMIAGAGSLFTTGTIFDQQMNLWMSTTPHWVIWTFAISAVIALALPIYAIIRSMVRKEDTPPMATSSKVSFILVWLLSLAISIACVIYGAKMYDNAQHNFRNDYKQSKIELMEKVKDVIQEAKDAIEFSIEQKKLENNEAIAGKNTTTESVPAPAGTDQSTVE